MPEQIPIQLRVSLDAVEAERILVRFLQDYVADSGRKGFVVGLSGGLDSSLAATLAVRALGARRVHPLVLPERGTPESDLDDARAVARWLGLDPLVQTLDPLLEAFAKTVPSTDRAVLGNAKARFRMILLHAAAAQRNALVLGTGNKSELLTGYFSKYGDGGVDVQPLGDLYKTQVRLLARHLQIPERVIEKPPTAGLYAGQTDEAELGLPYETLDRVLLGLELHLPHDRIASIVGIRTSEVERVETLRRTTQHKRRLPLSPKIGLRTVGLDWRAATLERSG